MTPNGRPDGPKARPGRNRQIPAGRDAMRTSDGGGLRNRGRRREDVPAASAESRVGGDLEFLFKVVGLCGRWGSLLYCMCYRLVTAPGSAFFVCARPRRSAAAAERLWVAFLGKIYETEVP